MSEVTLLFDAAQIARRVEELAWDIAKTVSGDLVLVGLLKGSFVFAADLVRALDAAGLRPRVDFIRLSSYGARQQSSGRVELEGELPAEIAGRTVLVVDDIIDGGRTLLRARELLMAAGAARVLACALLDKPSRRQVDSTADFVGFTIEDRFVVGYGLDFAERYRHLPYIGVLD